MKRKAALWLLLGFALLLVATFVIGSALSPGYRTDLTCCAHDPGTGGGLGLARWAAHVGHEVHLADNPLWNIAEELEARNGNCAITAGNADWSPWGAEMGADEWRKLRQWITAGNSLIIVTSMPDELPAPVLAVFGRSRRDRSRGALNIEFEDAVDAKPETVEIQVERDHLTVCRDGPRWNEPAAAGKTAVDARGSVLHRVVLGAGAVYLLLDDFAWTNAGFDRGGNAAVLATILDRDMQRGSLVFDEYRHGHGRVESFLTFALSLPGAPAFLAISALLCGAYVFGRGRRFGPADPYERPERRTAREYIDSVAGLYERARAAPLAVRAVVQRARFVAAHRGRTDPRFEECLQRAEQYAAHGDRPAQPTEACGLVSDILRLKEQIYGA